LKTQLNQFIQDAGENHNMSHVGVQAPHRSGG